MSQPYLTELWVSNICPICDGEEYITDGETGEEVCINCGCVLNDLIMMRGITAYDYDFDNPPSKHRAYGFPKKPSVYDYGLNTFMIGKTDGAGAPIKPDALSEFRRLQKRNSQSKTDETTTRNLSIAMIELNRLSSTLNIPKYVKEEAAQIYRRALKKDLIRGRSIDAFVAASIYAACRLNKTPRPLKTVTDESKRNQKEVSQTYRLLLEKLCLKPPIDKPYKYIPELANSLGVSRQTELLAVKLLRDADKTKTIVGKDPRGVAAAVIYLACEVRGEKIIQSEVAKVAETTGVTLRNRYRGLKEALNIV